MFKISLKLNLPEDAALWSIAELAIRGAGKTYTASVIAEEFVRAGIPITVIDGMGVWWGLRVGVDGHEGLPVVVFGGDHKDISIPVRSDKGRPIVDEERLKLMVKAILEARMSAILDTSEFSKGMQRRIVAIFVNELYHLNKNYGVRHVFIEEADLWCPQRIVADVAQSAGAIDDLVRRGGNFNLGCTLITQRSAVLNKDVLSQCSCLVVLRILHRLDKQAVQGWVESVAHPDDPRIKKWYDSLKALKNGEAWIWHPESDLFERIQFRKRETLHATREYFRQAEFEQKDIRMMDVDSFVRKFKAVFEPKPAPVKQVEKPVVPIIEQRGVVSSPPIQQSTESPSLHVINQMLPNIQVEQFKPNIRLGVELPDEPTTILGKVCIVLKNGPAPSNRNDRWNPTLIRKRIEGHAWDAQGIEDAIDQLIRWEILSPAAQYLRFDPSRIERKDRGAMVPA
jgi:hypothetical protein